MTKAYEQTYQIVHDVMTMPSRLNAIAREHEAEGFAVERGAFGMVILKLDDGEVHFVPSSGSIKMVVFN